MLIAAALQVALANLLLSSDNVLMVALTSGRLPRVQRRSALVWSLFVSVALQLGILFLVAYLFHFRILQAAFGVIICVMAFQLIRTHQPHAAAASEGQPVGKTVSRIVVGNLLMSFENEAALITLAQGNVWLAWVGVVATSPLIFFGSHMMATLLRRYPLILYVGAVYLFGIGCRLLASASSVAPAALGQAAWALTAVFAAYVALRYLRRGRARSGARQAG